MYDALQVYVVEAIVLKSICISRSHIFHGSRSAEELMSPDYREPIPED